MTKRTQRFVFLGVTILIVGLGTGLVASYVGLPNFGLVGSDGPVELAYEGLIAIRKTAVR